MVMTGLFLAGWSIIDLLNKGESQGLFKYILPFLLVFALIYGILSNMRILGENKGVHAIIAVALGLLSLYNDFLPNFVEDFAPSLAIGLSILLAAIILFGLFIGGDEDSKISWIKYILFGVAAIVFIIVAYSSLNNYNFVGSWAWQEYAPAFIVLLIIVALIAFMIWGGSSDGSGKPPKPAKSG